MKRQLHDGRADGLEPLESLDVKRTDTIAGLLRDMRKTAFGGRQMGNALEVLCKMASRRQCKIIVTVSGAITIAKMGLVLCDMIEHGLADIVVSTGAIMAHGISETIGGLHYKYNPELSDEKLFQKGYNRVYDTLEMEANLCDTERLIGEVLDACDCSELTGSAELNERIGLHLIERGMMPSILGCAAKHKVPVYVPAFTDSEMGLDVATHSMQKAGTGNTEAGIFGAIPHFNPFTDLYDYAERAVEADELGIITIGGGVPRNWAQQVGPFIDIVNMRMETEFTPPRFRYGVRICPEPAFWGGLSGCTYSEGVSWGKFLSPAEGGMFAEIHCDATIAWPILIRGVLEEIGALAPVTDKTQNT